VTLRWQRRSLRLAPASRRYTHAFAPSAAKALLARSSAHQILKSRRKAAELPARCAAIPASSSLMSMRANRNAFDAAAGGDAIATSAASLPDSMGRIFSMNLNISPGVEGCAEFAPRATTAFWFHTRQAAFALATHCGLVDAIADDTRATPVAPIAAAIANRLATPPAPPSEIVPRTPNKVSAPTAQGFTGE
jgi:hypothetical protein